MKPGRKSTYDLLEPIIPGKPPPPPEELEPDQQLEWKTITEGLPGDWFSAANDPLLKELCRHITYARELASCELSLGCPSGPDRGSWSCEASGFSGGPDERA